MANIEVLNDFINRDIAFPADKQEILDHARRRHLPEDVMTALHRIPDRMYSEPMDVLHTTII